MTYRILMAVLEISGTAFSMVSCTILKNEQNDLKACKITLKACKITHVQMGLNTTNPVFWVSDKARLKPVSSATETS